MNFDEGFSYGVANLSSFSFTCCNFLLMFFFFYIIFEEDSEIFGVDYPEAMS
jgi:hypothetical protein